MEYFTNFALSNKQKKMDRVFEYYVSMLPLSERYQEYENFAFDRIHAGKVLTDAYGNNQEFHPVKLMFTAMGICTKGTMRLRLNLTEYELHENDIIIILPNTIIDKAQWSDDLNVATIYVKEVSLSHPLFSNIALRYHKHLSNSPWLLKCPRTEVDDILRICEMARNVISNDDMAYKQELLYDSLHAIAIYLLNALRRNDEQQDESRNLPRQTQLLLAFQSLVRQHYMEHRDVAFYASKMCITPKYLSIVIKQASGRRAIDWIRDFVILDAKAMILSGNYTMQQISDTLHFANPSFFGKYFKEAVGCSPGAFAEST